MTITLSVACISGRRVLVTGAAGFLGSHLCRSLSAAGANVYGVTRGLPMDLDRDISWEQADLADEASVRLILKSVRPDVVYHLAGHGSGAPDLENVLPTFRNDLTTTINVVAIATELRLSRIVLAASLEEPSAQDADIPPASPYAAAKWSASIYSRMFYYLYRSPIVTVRPFMTYGPGQKRHKLVPYVILSLLRNESPKLSSGQRVIDWIYVDDVIKGMLAAGTVSGIEGGCFDLGSGELVSIQQMVKLLERLIGVSIEPQFGSLPERPGERLRAANLADTVARLGWWPRTSLEDGLRCTVEWYKNHLLSFPTENMPLNS